MKMRVQFISTEILARALIEMPAGIEFGFTLDRNEDDFYCDEPSGWHGVKKMDLFDSPNGVIAFGYYGGFYDFECIPIPIEDDEEKIVAVREVLERYATNEGWRDGDNICVEITNENRKYIYNEIVKTNPYIIKRGDEIILLTDEEISRIFREKGDEYYIEDFESGYIVPEDKKYAIADAFAKSLERCDGYWDCYWSLVDYVAKEFNLEEVTNV